MFGGLKFKPGLVFAVIFGFFIAFYITINPCYAAARIVGDAGVKAALETAYGTVHPGIKIGLENGLFSVAESTGDHFLRNNCGIDTDVLSRFKLPLTFPGQAPTPYSSDSTQTFQAMLEQKYGPARSNIPLFQKPASSNESGLSYLDQIRANADLMYSVRLRMQDKLKAFQALRRGK